MSHLPNTRARRVLLQSCFVPLVLWASAWTSYYAQNASDVTRTASAIQKVPAASPQTFADYFTQVAAQNHITIAAENTPLRLTITAEEKQTLLASVQNQPLQKSLREQAAFFDYDCDVQSPRVFVLRKKYTDSSDLPYVSMDEAVQLLSVSDRFISRFKSPFKNGSFESDPAFMETARSFTDEQLALMKQTKLPMTSLTPTQRQQMWNAFLALYLDDGALRFVSISLEHDTHGKRRRFSPLP